MKPDTKCKRCGWEWYKRTVSPAQCPHCKSLKWQTPKKLASIVVDPETVIVLDAGQ